MGQAASSPTTAGIPPHQHPLYDSHDHEHVEPVLRSRRSLPARRRSWGTASPGPRALRGAEVEEPVVTTSVENRRRREDTTNTTSNPHDQQQQQQFVHPDHLRRPTTVTALGHGHEDHQEDPPPSPPPRRRGLAAWRSSSAWAVTSTSALGSSKSALSADATTTTTTAMTLPEPAHAPQRNSRRFRPASSAGNNHNNNTSSSTFSFLAARSQSARNLTTTPPTQTNSSVPSPPKTTPRREEHQNRADHRPVAEVESQQDPVPPAEERRRPALARFRAASARLMTRSTPGSVDISPPKKITEEGRTAEWTLPLPRPASDEEKIEEMDASPGRYVGAYQPDEESLLPSLVSMEDPMITAEEWSATSPDDTGSLRRITADPWPSTWALRDTGMRSRWALSPSSSSGEATGSSSLYLRPPPPTQPMMSSYPSPGGGSMEEDGPMTPPSWSRLPVPLSQPPPHHPPPPPTQHQQALSPADLASNSSPGPFDSPPRLPYQQAFPAWMASAEGGGPMPRNNSMYATSRRSSYNSTTGSSVSDLDEDALHPHNDDFYPIPSGHYEWMGRSIESLILGHVASAPVLQLPVEDGNYDDGAGDYSYRRRSTASTFGGLGRRRSSQGSFPGGRRGSLSLTGNMHGGTLANYYNLRRPVPTDVDRSLSDRSGRRRGSTHGPMYRRRSSMAATPGSESTLVTDGIHARIEADMEKGGPNVLLSIMARESTGKSCFGRGIPVSQSLREMGGHSLFAALDKPAGGIASEVAFLAAAIDSGDWSETHQIVSRLVGRLIGDPTHVSYEGGGSPRRSSIDDPNLPPTAPRFYAGGGRLGLERDAFCLAGGVEVLIRMFREKNFVGEEMYNSYDARDLSEEIVANRLAPCWNEALTALRELVYYIPSLVETGTILDDGNFLLFLFTLLSHNACFDTAAALIEEILSFMSQNQQQSMNHDADGATDSATSPSGRILPATTFFLGNVPDLYKLWEGFNCRQLAHFCRILSLLVFEPEDRQLLESPAVLKSLELLQLRRNRASRSARDSTVDMNQSILLGDEELIVRLIKLLTVMNYGPPLRRFSPYHVLAHFPFIVDTLVMLGLGELENWEEIDRQNRLARKLLDDVEIGVEVSEEQKLLCELGTVADMLEGLSDTLMNGNRQAPNQIGHIISVIAAAQQAGVIFGRTRRRERMRNSSREANRELASVDTDDVPINGNTMQGLASVAGILTDQILVRRLYQSVGQDPDDDVADAAASVRLIGLDIDGNHFESTRHDSFHLINTSEDAANSLQFNALLLGSYQVEVLFVLCTLLGGRRKLDAQDMLNRLGIVPVLDDMFQRLPWHKRRRQVNEIEPPNGQDSNQQLNGIHGPGCECTPESALCVQYLRLLHNFCDRDCDNYAGRRLLLSLEERDYVFGRGRRTPSPRNYGLLSKIIDAFIRESDESPYRFWLSSCIESYLRGSSPEEQIFVAESGLLDHLVQDISSERLHCAGSLQTSFDLLGELSKGNADVVRMIVNDLNEESFRKVLSVAAANLVDSNVFIRSLLLSLERLSTPQGLIPLYMDTTRAAAIFRPWESETGFVSRTYLTHSWWDAPSYHLATDNNSLAVIGDDDDRERACDWFPTRELATMDNMDLSEIPLCPSGLSESVGHFGWVFTPTGDTLTAEAYLPNTLERLSWFLAANQARLLRDLLGVVDLRNINHENICCLNTAVVIAIFAHRRQHLAELLHELRQMNDEEQESKRRAYGAERQDDVVDRAFVQAMRYLDLDQRRESPPYSRLASIVHTNGAQQIGDRSDVMRNFREVLWFWREYYTHRGRDRLSLEFSSHIRFQEWNYVVSLLVSDDGSSTALVRSPVRLPRSPYQRAARTPERHVS